MIKKLDFHILLKIVIILSLTKWLNGPSFASGDESIANLCPLFNADVQTVLLTSHLALPTLCGTVVIGTVKWVSTKWFSTVYSVPLGTLSALY